jgi:hypothetical protein
MPETDGILSYLRSRYPKLFEVPDGEPLFPTPPLSPQVRMAKVDNREVW